MVWSLTIDSAFGEKSLQITPKKVQCIPKSIQPGKILLHFLNNYIIGTRGMRDEYDFFTKRDEHGQAAGI